MTAAQPRPPGVAAPHRRTERRTLRDGRWGEAGQSQLTSTQPQRADHCHCTRISVSVHSLSSQHSVHAMRTAVWWRTAAAADNGDRSSRCSAGSISDGRRGICLGRAPDLKAVSGIVLSSRTGPPRSAASPAAVAAWVLAIALTAGLILCSCAVVLPSPRCTSAREVEQTSESS